MQTQHFRAQPEGKIQSGDLTYTLDTKTGEISYDANVTVKIAWFPISKNFKGRGKIEPAMLQSSHYQKAGDKLVMGDFIMTVTSISRGQATCSLKFQGYSGIGLLDVSGPVVKILSLNAIGSVPVLGDTHLILQAV